MAYSDSIQLEYEALTNQVGLFDLSGRTQIAIVGSDRTKFLQGMCTNDIQALEPGSGCEAFLTDVQGKTSSYVFVSCHPTSLLLDTVAAQSETIIQGLDRYIIREDVELLDRSDARGELLVCGPQAESLLAQRFSQAAPQRPLDHVEAQLAGADVVVYRVPFAGPHSFFLSCDLQHRDALVLGLQEAGGLVCGPIAVEVARIESATPLFGCDITPDNLPQEVNRNTSAISFTKGCYIGQETVARIDALGHVNRTLEQLQFDSSEVPPVGTQCYMGEKTVARITSSCWSLKLGAPLALAYVRRGYQQIGTKLPSDYGEAEVVSI